MLPMLRLATLLGLVLLAGCSATQLAYNRLDLLADWRLRDYVRLDAAQQTLFEREFAQAWARHRREELPRYASFLRRLGEARGLPDAAALTAASREYDESWKRLSALALPIGCALGPGLSEAQVAQVLAGVDQDLAEYVEEEIAPGEAERRRERERELLRGLRRSFGSLDPAQRELLRRWNQDRVWVAEPWLDYRRRWRQALAELLAERRQASFCPRLDRLLSEGSALWTETQWRLFRANRQSWLDLFLALGPTLSEEQRETWRQRVGAVAAELESLAAGR